MYRAMALPAVIGLLTVGQVCNLPAWEATLIGKLQTCRHDVEPKTAADWLRKGKEEYSERKYAEAVASLTKCLKLDADNDEALDLRGSSQFMRGKFVESVADFNREIALKPEKANGHWRRGISLFYAGKYEAGKKQFEGYEKVDTNDVENAVWHFLCAARKDGVKKARASMLKIGKDRRVPLMQVYELFKGTLKPADVLTAANAGTLADEQRKPMLFYAHLYLGLYHDVLGEKKKAAEHMALAAGKYKIGHYMGEVARVHHELLMKK
jgi:lipoprotein NlpI